MGRRIMGLRSDTLHSSSSKDGLGMRHKGSPMGLPQILLQSFVVKPRYEMILNAEREARDSSLSLEAHCLSAIEEKPPEQS